MNEQPEGCRCVVVEQELFDGGKTVLLKIASCPVEEHRQYQPGVKFEAVSGIRLPPDRQ